VCGFENDGRVKGGRAKRGAAQADVARQTETEELADADGAESQRRVCRTAVKSRDGEERGDEEKWFTIWRRRKRIMDGRDAYFHGGGRASLLVGDG
jgi:hypothetical protein